VESDLPALLDDDTASGSAARRFLFRETGQVESPAEVVGWWEKRRLAYNAAVGAAGLTSLVAIHAAIPGPGGPPLVAIAMYALAANVMYTGGWMAELALLRPLFGRRTPVVGATLFRYGFAFAVGLTLIPVPVAVTSLVFRAIAAIF
jgi:hypothetical protein